MLKKLCLIILGFSLTLYIAICLLLRWQQTSLIFFPHRLIRSTPQKYNLDYQDVWLNVDQEKIHGWWLPSSKQSAPVLLYFHGNASNNGDLIDLAAILHDLGVSILLIDYRGYGKSSPTFPNESRVYQDALAAWQYLTKNCQIKPQNIFVYGHSLGGAIAVDLATKHPEMAGIIIEGTFTSIKDVASLDKFLQIFPLNLILTQHFDTITKIQSLQTPLLILHGKKDEIIPISMAKKLFTAAPKPKQLVIIPHARHNDLPQVGNEQYFWSLKQFIQSNYANESNRNSRCQIM
ncbi:MAG: alpha/beta hydrolase [Pleurocapsa sp.]